MNVYYGILGYQIIRPLGSLGGGGGNRTRVQRYRHLNVYKLVSYLNFAPANHMNIICLC